MAHYYGIECMYGRNVTDSEGNRRGDVHVFGTKAERDAWVDADEFDGNWHRDAIGSGEARRLMLDSEYFVPSILEIRYHILQTEAHYATMDQIVDCYRPEWL